MRRFSCLCIVLLLAASAYAAVGRIAGLLLDEKGTPVPSMIVEAAPVGMAWGGGIPQCKTDSSGRFQIELLLGKWDLYPRSDGDLYPALSPFFVTETSQGKLIELTDYHPEAVIELRLGPKAGAIIGHATDANSGAILHPHFELAWASGEPTKRMGIATGDPYRILLPPDKDIRMVVSCEGYETWTYPGTIKVRSGEVKTLNIKLIARTLKIPN